MEAFEGQEPPRMRGAGGQARQHRQTPLTDDHQRQDRVCIAFLRLGARQGSQRHQSARRLEGVGAEEAQAR